ncbi:UNVERIFIED_CONTAM: hypothetical protein Sradi_4859300 [Sesamum radiatum]|uniref:Uncharacterized protein n=1 Tax=Sesamum radiatum TaxID=300843 RepID=A0AAW2N0A0_SESRA
MTWVCSSRRDLDRILEVVEEEVRGDVDQVLRVAMGEGASEEILPTPMVEDGLGPLKEAEAEEVPTPQEEVVDDA